MFDIKHLRQFITIAETNSLSKAAIAFGIQQSALTKSMQRLEEQVGARLIDRSSSGVTLTAIGCVLLEEARYVVEQADQAQARVRRHIEQGKHHLVIGAVGEAIFNNVATPMLQLRERHADVAIKVVEAGTVDLIRLLKAGEVDIAFLQPVRREADDFVMRLVRRNRIMLAVPADHALARRGAVGIADLAGWPFVLLQSSMRSGVRRVFEQACNAEDIALTVVQEVPRYHLGLALVAGGLGVTIIPESVQDLVPHNVVLVPIEAAPAYLNANIMIGWNPLQRSELAREFIAFALTAAPDIPERK